MLGFLKDYWCVMIDIEIKPGAIVEAFDQKDGEDLREHFRSLNLLHSHQ
jgi:hypothetical protein